MMRSDLLIHASAGSQGRHRVLPQAPNKSARNGAPYSGGQGAGKDDANAGNGVTAAPTTDTELTWDQQARKLEPQCLNAESLPRAGRCEVPTHADAGSASSPSSTK